MTRKAETFIGTREEAKAKGVGRYIDGRLCGRNHSPTIRLTSNTQCVACRDLKSAELKQEGNSKWGIVGFIPDVTLGNYRVFRGPHKEAKAAGALYYLNRRRPCTEGHDPTIRLTSTTACVECAREYHFAHRDEINAKKRQLWADDPEPRRAKERGRYAENPDYFKWYASMWLEDNRAHKRQMDAIWRAENAEWLTEYYAAWARANPDKMAAKAHKRRALKLGSTEHFTAEDVREIFVLQRGCCACCRKKLDSIEARDHIIALSKGGSNGRRNIQITCSPCNFKKGARDPIEFMQKEFGLLL